MPQIYGIEHIIYLLIVIPLMIVSTLWIRRVATTEEKLQKIIKIIGILGLIAITVNRISVSYLKDGFDKILPGTFCGTSSLMLALSAVIFKKDSIVFHSVLYVGLLGGLLTLFYPEFIGQGPTFFYPMTITAMIHHTLMVFLAWIMLASGYVRPTLSKWKYLPIGLSFYMSYGLFLITVLGYHDALYIYEPILPDTFLNWAGLGSLLLPVHAIFLWVWDRYLKNVFPIIHTL
jgi:hypothetical protein